MLLILFISFLFTFLIGVLSFTKARTVYKYLWVFPGLLFAMLLINYQGVIGSTAQPIIESMSWVSILDIDFQFSLTGWSYFFSLLITGIGTLIFYYAGAYMKNKERQGAFFSYLAFFMMSMLGLVFADNLIVLFVFWELTSIASFFLIGFDYQEKEVRQSAILSLGITGGGGFFLLLAFILIGTSMGTFNLSEIDPAILVDSLMINGTLIWVIISLIIGAITKSAQFPFHFWLPNAMKAPTPVSAYLHSATMVKAGVFILAVFAPYFQGVELWHNILFVTGLVTLVYAAFQSLFQKDLKGILAYSTIASLGMMVLLIGLGTSSAYLALVLFVLAHALYKAALFITAGTIDYITGTRNVNELRGMKSIVGILGIAAFIVACSNGGFPLTIGFMAKDYIYVSLLELESIKWLVLVIVILGNVALMFAGLLVGWRPFMGQASAKVLQAPMMTKKSLVPLWLPVMILAIMSVVFGVFPEWTFNHILKSSYAHISGHELNKVLSVFPGFNMVLLLSLVTLVLGLSFYFIRKGVPYHSKLWDEEGRFNIFRQTLKFYQTTKRAAFSYTRLLHSGYLRSYILYIVLFFIGLVGYKFFTGVDLKIPDDKLSTFGTYEVVVFIIITLAIINSVFTPSRLTAIASMGIMGYSMCLMFVFYGAPDLAMTQFSIDTLTVVLFVLVLYKLPRFNKYVSWKIELRDGIVSVAFGFLIAMIALQAYSQPVVKEVSDFYANHAYLKAKGKNVVNVILVDFRGIDTMVEIIVLAIAAVGVFSLLKLNLNKVEKD